MNQFMNIDALVSILQASIAPCVLISGVGLLLLSMTNRVARPIDRLRQVLKERETATGPRRQNLDAQVSLLYRRCRMLRSAIALAIACIFSISFIILLLFATLVYHLPAQPLVQWLFAVSLLCLLTSLALFFADIHLTMSTVALEMEAHRDD